MVSQHKANLTRALRTTKESQAIASVRARTQTLDGSGLLEALVERSMDVTATYSAILGREKVLLLLPDGDVVIVPRSCVETTNSEIATLNGEEDQQAGQRVSVDLSIGLCPPEDVSTLLGFLQSCFGGRLTSLSLHIFHGATFTEERMASILAAFPTLLCLKLRHTELMTMDVFLSAYRTQRCQIRVLSIDSGSVGFIPFFEELGSPTSAVTNTLREQKLGYPRNENDGGEAYLHAVESMLEHNTQLQFFGLSVKKVSSALITKIASTLQRFHRTPLAVAAFRPLSLRAKLAFIGAVTPPDTCKSVKRPRTGLGSPRATSGLSLEPMRNVLAFAAPCMLRIVELTHELVGCPKIAKTEGGTRYSERVEDRIVSLAVSGE